MVRVGCEPAGSLSHIPFAIRMCRHTGVRRRLERPFAFRRLGGHRRVHGYGGAAGLLEVGQDRPRPFREDEVPEHRDSERLQRRYRWRHFVVRQWQLLAGQLRRVDERVALLFRQYYNLLEFLSEYRIILYPPITCKVEYKNRSRAGTAGTAWYSSTPVRALVSD